MPRCLQLCSPSSDASLMVAMPMMEHHSWSVSWALNLGLFGEWFSRFWRDKLHRYRWWFRNPKAKHRLDGAKKSVVNHGDKLPTSKWLAGFQPSTVSLDSSNAPVGFKATQAYGQSTACSLWRLCFESYFLKHREAHTCQIEIHTYDTICLSQEVLMKSWLAIVTTNASVYWVLVMFIE